MSEPDIPPLDPEARALLERTKGTVPTPAPSDVRSRARARLEDLLDPEGGSDVRSDAAPAARSTRLASGVRFPPVGRSRIEHRALRAAPWIAAACLVATVGVRMGRRAMDRAAMRADRPDNIDPSLRCDEGVSLDDDPANCGRCGHECCGGSCEHGICQPLVLAQGYHPGSPAVDASYVYWPDGRDTVGRIMKTPKRGGDSVALASGQRHPWGAAVHGGYVYWVTNSDVAPAYGGVFKVPVGGGDVETLVASGEAFANGIVVNDSGIYWDDYGEYTPAAQATSTDACAPGARIRKFGLDGEGPVTLASPESGVCTPLLMAVDAHDAYWPNRFGRSIQKVSTGGGRAATIATASDPLAVAVEGGYVYWINWKEGTLQRAAVGGGSVETVATSGSEVGPNGGVGPNDLVVDVATAFWTRQGPPWGSSGAVLFASISAPPETAGAVLATSPSPEGLAMDAACVYWADAADGKIRAVAKP